MKDYIIVGAGIAGICFAETAYLNGKSFVVYNDASQNSSRVAAGIYNPVILKRFKITQHAAEYMACITPFYKNIENRLQVSFYHDSTVYRKFFSAEEQNNWFEAADKPGLSDFLSTEVIYPDIKYLPSQFGFAGVKGTGYADTKVLLAAYHTFLQDINALYEESFDYSAIQVNGSSVIYKGQEARHIIFAEGYGITKNPFFNNLPLAGTKGELLLIHAPDLKLDITINAGLFILPVGNDMYKVGATYEWEDKTLLPTVAGKQELVEKLEEIITCKYEIVDHYAGIRPTVKDRKPLIGTHPHYKRLHLLNGLGTRGIMLGPPMAQQLYDVIENGKEPEREVNLMRFI